MGVSDTSMSDTSVDYMGVSDTSIGLDDVDDGIHSSVRPPIAVAAVLLCLVLSALMVSGKLVEIAERQPLGPVRDRWMSAAAINDRVANFLSINRPYDLMSELRGSGHDPGEQINSIDVVAIAAGLDDSGNSSIPQASRELHPNPSFGAYDWSVPSADHSGSADTDKGTPSHQSNHGQIPQSNHGQIPQSNHGQIPQSNHGQTPQSNHGQTPYQASDYLSADHRVGDIRTSSSGVAGSSGVDGYGSSDSGDLTPSSDESGSSGVDGYGSSDSGDLTSSSDESGSSGVDGYGSSDSGDLTSSSDEPGSSGVDGYGSSDSGDLTPSSDEPGSNVEESGDLPSQTTSDRPVVSVSAPLRIYVAGDSQSYYLGMDLKQGRFSELFDMEVDNRHSTGLARPDYFNWPAHLVGVASSNPPDLVVLFMGSNDWQNMSSREIPLSRGSPEWQSEWAWRLAVTFEVLAASGSHIIWVGLPPSRIHGLQNGFALMNRLAAGVIAERDDVTMVDIWEIFGGDGPYRASVPPPGDPSGASVVVRQSDGTHLNVAGARWVASLVREVISQRWDLADG